MLLLCGAGVGGGRCRFGDGFLTRGLGSGRVVGFELGMVILLLLLVSRLGSC